MVEVWLRAEHARERLYVVDAPPVRVNIRLRSLRFDLFGFIVALFDSVSDPMGLADVRFGMYARGNG